MDGQQDTKNTSCTPLLMQAREGDANDIVCNILANVLEAMKQPLRTHQDLAEVCDHPWKSDRAGAARSAGTEWQTQVKTQKGFSADAGDASVLVHDGGLCTTRQQPQRRANKRTSKQLRKNKKKRNQKVRRER